MSLANAARSLTRSLRTFLLTDALDPLFPTAAGIALWALVAGVGQLMHRRRE
jgi:hypothetical protein